MRSGLLPALCLLVTACQHTIVFEDIDYAIEGKTYDAGLRVVIDESTLEGQVTIKSFMTGIAQSWNAQPGMMMKQVADVEFPQMFQHYEVVVAPSGSWSEGQVIDLWLAVPSYTFSDFRATVQLQAIAKSRDGRTLFDKSYSDSGVSQGGKMFWGGAFGMKSAVRQSSIDAYKKVFGALREDIHAAMSELGSG